MQFPHSKTILCRLRGVAALEDFRPKLIVLNFASPQDRFSTGQLSVLRFDFLRDFLKGSNLVNEFFANSRKNDFCAKPEVPRGLLRKRHQLSQADLSESPFC